MLTPQGIAGDDALLRLARERFREAGIGGEFYPGAPDHFRALHPFIPANMPVTAHLPRYLDIANAATLDEVVQYAQIGSNRFHGMILHDSPALMEARYDVAAAIREADRRLDAVPGRPLLFVEYAAGNPPEAFAELFEEHRDLQYVSACIDISHVAIKAAQTAFGRAFPGLDVCQFKPEHPGLPEKWEAVESACREARQVVLELVTRLARLGKPLHFHLHDGHPASTLSRYGVSDHLGFLQQLRLPFRIPAPGGGAGVQNCGGIFGPAGLRAVLRAALDALPPEQLSFTLEIHPQDGRVPLGPHAGLFSHWRDTANAERMNFWIEMLLENAQLVRDGFSTAV
jgi:hypothetical protein